MRCRSCSLILTVTVTALASAATAAQAAQMDNFNSGTDTNWTDYDPLAEVGAPGEVLLPQRRLSDPGRRLAEPASRRSLPCRQSPRGCDLYRLHGCHRPGGPGAVPQ